MTRSYLTWCSVFLNIFVWTFPAQAVEVGLAGIMGGKALLVVDGAPPRAFAAGQSIDGIKLLSVQSDSVHIEAEGRRRTLRIGQHAVATPDPDGLGRLVIAADSRGHFFHQGEINGVPVRFLVDTGATMISLGASDAKRIGLRLGMGDKVMTQTANGTVEVTRLQLDTVRLGEITLHAVEALVHPHDLPVALLGMSFLNRMEMQRSGGQLTLKKRY